MGRDEIYLVYCLIMFAFMNRAKVFYYMTSLGTIIAISESCKIIYHKPMPYMEDPSIFPKNCVIQYAHPSGHSYDASAFPLVVFLDYFH